MAVYIETGIGGASELAYDIKYINTLYLSLYKILKSKEYISR